MSTNSKIEWTDTTWNVVTGCTKVSQGCKHCYAERIANRFWGERKFTDVICHHDRLEIPLKWRKPRRVFVNSMSDLFHQAVPDSFIDSVWAIMAQTPQNTYQILTKRPKRMYNYLTQASIYLDQAPLQNVWLGVSAEDQAAADERIPWLLRTPAAVRFVSVEPMLGSVNLIMAAWFKNPFAEKNNLPPNGIGLDWIIAGCESGPSARPMSPEWVRPLRDQCNAAGVPFFLKQMVIDGKLVKMPELDGKVWNEYP